MYLLWDWRPKPHSGKPMWEMRPGMVLGARETRQSKSKHHYLEDKPVPTWFFIPGFWTWKIKCLCPDQAAGSSETVSCLHKSCYVAISGCGLEGRCSPAKEHCRAPEGWRFLTLCGRHKTCRKFWRYLELVSALMARANETWPSRTSLGNGQAACMGSRWLQCQSSLLLTWVCASDVFRLFPPVQAALVLVCSDVKMVFITICGLHVRIMVSQGKILAPSHSYRGCGRWCGVSPSPSPVGPNSSPRGQQQPSVRQDVLNGQQWLSWVCFLASSSRGFFCLFFGF